MSKKVRNKTLKLNTGFSDTLTSSVSKINPNICLPIFMNGQNVNKNYFYPSEFPNLTKIKPFVNLAKGGKKSGKKSKKNKLYKRSRKRYIKSN
jgi:hypothetical protein